jgi:dTDP-4-amino-4,6-dideoxygalactose transaminase
MKLAQLGGKKSIKSQVKKYSWFDRNSEKIAKEIIRTGNLSGFLAQENNSHFGGPYVKSFEEAFSRIFKFDHAVSFNSWTSGLEASIGVIGLETNAEVIVPAWTMSASVSAIMLNNLKPVLVDIEMANFNVSLKEIESAITPRTQAILAVDIFGYPCNVEEIRSICRSKSLALIIDAAQTPLAKVHGKRTTEFADIGGYSLNRHKHIQVGEGGVAVTNNPVYADSLRGLRNHGEVSAGSSFRGVGRNYRLGEIESALALIQVEKLDYHVNNRRYAANFLIKELSDLPGIEFPQIQKGFDHDFYILGLKLDQRLLDVSRDKIYSALEAEGVPGLLKNYSALQHVNAFKQFADHKLSNIDELNTNQFLGIYICGFDFKKSNLIEISKAFHKVWENLSFLK